MAGLTLALKLASSNLHDLYLRATPPVRRLMNQAIFKFIWVWDEDHIRAELASPFKELAAISQATTATLPARELTAPIEDDQASDIYSISEDLVVGSITEVMVELARLELATSWVRCDWSAAAVDVKRCWFAGMFARSRASVGAAWPPD